MRQFLEEEVVRVWSPHASSALSMHKNYFYKEQSSCSLILPSLIFMKASTMQTKYHPSRFQKNAYTLSEFSVLPRHLFLKCVMAHSANSSNLQTFGRARDP